MSVCCVLSGTGLCDELITRPEEANEIQQDATVYTYLFSANLLYMFRVSTAPIIRGT